MTKFCIDVYFLVNLNETNCAILKTRTGAGTEVRGNGACTGTGAVIGTVAAVALISVFALFNIIII